MFAFASRIWACGIAGCLLLSGCATLPPSPTGPSIAALPAAGMPLHTFDAIEQAAGQLLAGEVTGGEAGGEFGNGLGVHGSIRTVVGGRRPAGAGAEGRVPALDTPPGPIR